VRFLRVRESTPSGGRGRGVPPTGARNAGTPVCVGDAGVGLPPHSL
jgi:hypothetical protein